MAKTEHYYERFAPNCVYHIYNRAVDKKPLFKNRGNFIFFLKRYDYYLSELLTTYSYALCGNHFHLGVKIKSETALLTYVEHNGLQGRYATFHDLVTRQFQRFFLSYAKAFNKQQKRVGTLFQTPFKRCLVNSDEKLLRMIFYHHGNPQHHKIYPDFRTYPWTSYPRYLRSESSKLPKQEIFDMLGGRSKFIEYHDQWNASLQDSDDWFIEG